MKTVVFQGMPGAYSEQAIKKFFTKSYKTIPKKDFRSAFIAVEKGDVDFGIIPIENSMAGSIHENYDWLRKKKVKIVGEIVLKVKHHLLAKPGAKISSIKKVYSHPQALAQCQSYLRRLKGVEPISYFDTAGSARFIESQDSLEVASIASAEAAKVYGLKILESGIEDHVENYTRFLALAALDYSPSYKIGSRSKYKTSIVFALKNIPGCLHKCLSVFTIRDIDLTKIESRPLPGSIWQYLFYVDLAGYVEEEKISNALKHLQEITKFFKLLGSYQEAKVLTKPN